MTKNYGRPAVLPITFQFEDAQLATTETHIILSRKDVLGIVQAAFDELGLQSPELIAIKREVLEEVAEGKLAHALRTAIVGAGKAHGQ